MSESQVESVSCSVETLLSDVMRVQTQCHQRSTELAEAAEQLRGEMRELRAQCETAQLDMAHMRRTLEKLLDSRAAFEARERQTRKLSKQL